MKKIILLFAGILAGAASVIGQPSPPVPPGFTRPPLVVEFGGPPVVGVLESRVFEHIRDFRLPTNYVVYTTVSNIPAVTWNATEGPKLMKLSLDIAGVSTNTISHLGDPLVPEALRAKCIEIYFYLGWVEHFEVAANGEIEMLWTGEPGFQHYMMLSKKHASEIAEVWKIKYINNRPWYALDADRIARLRTWSASQ